MKTMSLRYAGKCQSCAATLAAGTKAVYDPTRKVVTCLACAEKERDTVLDSAPPAPEKDIPHVLGAAGASARTEYERRKNKREERIRAAHPILGGLILAFSDDPQSTTAWAKGAVGEERLGGALDGLAGQGAYILHDRRVPRSKANIDHIVVHSSGIWVVDAKRYQGMVRLEHPGVFSSAKPKLRVGRRDCTSLVEGMYWQAGVIQKALAKDAAFEGVPIHPTLCFVDAEWPLFGGRIEIGGVRVTSPKGLKNTISQGGILTPEEVTRVAVHLAEHFPEK